MLIWCLDPTDCTSTTSWIEFLIAIWLLILVMIKTNGKTSKKWSKWIKSGATWARIRASEAPLAVYVTFYFPRNIMKNTCIKVFLPQSGILNKSIIHIVFMTMCTDVAKEAIFIYRWNCIFFNIFTHIFLDHVPHKTQNACYKLNKFCNLVQLWYVIISMMSLYSLNCTKNSTHLKIMVPGLRGPAGGPCKSEDITGWGLNQAASHYTIDAHTVSWHGVNGDIKLMYMNNNSSGIKTRSQLRGFSPACFCKLY